VLIVAAVPESSFTVADPRVGPWVDIHATWNPVKVSVAVLPFSVAKSTEPPLAPDSVCRVHPIASNQGTGARRHHADGPRPGESLAAGRVVISALTGPA